MLIIPSGLRSTIGRHVTDISPEELVGALKYNFTASLIYIWTVAFIKFTILAFYWQIFSIITRIPIAVVAFTVAVWLTTLVSHTDLPMECSSTDFISLLWQFLLATLCDPSGI